MRCPEVPEVVVENFHFFFSHLVRHSCSTSTWSSLKGKCSVGRNMFEGHQRSETDWPKVFRGLPAILPRSRSVHKEMGAMSTEALPVCLVACLFLKMPLVTFWSMRSPDCAQDGLLGIHSSRNTASRVQGSGASEKKHPQKTKRFVCPGDLWHRQWESNSSYHVMQIWGVWISALAHLGFCRR